MRRLLLFILFILAVPSAFALQKIFYTLRGDSTNGYQEVSGWIDTIKRHPNAIDVIISQAFEIDNRGTVWGGINHRLEQAAAKHHVKLMALVTNVGFNARKVSEFLRNRGAQQKAINDLTKLCKKHKLYGIQLDFENIPIEDRNRFTHFYRNLAKALHKHNFKISITLYALTDNIPKTTLLKNIYNNWAGAYDYKAIGKYSDFVTIMTYNQHMGSSTPGPVAGIPWVTQVIKHTLRYIPADKISLGIPTYSFYWKTGMHGNNRKSIGRDVNYDTVLSLLKENHVKLYWDSRQKVPYTYYNKHRFNEYIFVENARSFSEKLKLIKEYHLRGFSAWRLGLGDPGIWKLITHNS